MARLALVLALLPCAAMAQNCAEREQIISKLEKTYSEQFKFGGLQKTRGKRSVMEVWVSEETGSYTVLVTHANGLSCIVAVGTDFFEVMPKHVADGNPL